MSKNKEIGKKGESVAIDYLLSLGYSIREVNYYHRKKEIDIICEIDQTLVFVEVKTRRSSKFGMPEEAVDDRKIENILDCAGHYIERNRWKGAIRFDIIALQVGADVSIDHIKDAFY